MAQSFQKFPFNSSHFCTFVLLCFFASTTIPSAFGFSPLQLAHPHGKLGFQQPPPPQHGSITTCLHMAEVSLSTPSQSDAETMGIREWPQQAKSQGNFVESCKNGQTLVRYVLEGQGNVQVTSTQSSDKYAVKPGSLLQVEGEATLSWDITSKEMIILTPGFEQVGLFAGVAVGLVVLVGALIATS